MAADADLSKVWERLGELTAQTKELREQTRRIFELLEEIRAAAVQGALTEQRVAALEQKLERVIIPAVNDFTRIRNRGLGVIVGAGLAGGGLAEAIKYVVTLLQGRS